MESFPVKLVSVYVTVIQAIKAVPYKCSFLRETLKRLMDHTALLVQNIYILINVTVF